MATEPYVIRQGDYLDKLAYQLGTTPEAIWDAPENAELRAKRGDGTILHPGDLLAVPRPAAPPVAVQAGGSNDYAATIPTVEVKVRLVVAQEPYKNEEFEVEGLSEPQSGTTDGDGMATFQVPVTVREVRLILKRIRWAVPLSVGDMDPVDEPSGLQKRLVQLSYLDAYIPGDESERITMAIAHFQRDSGLPDSGLPDDATRAKLVEAYGS